MQGASAVYSKCNALHSGRAEASSRLSGRLSLGEMTMRSAAAKFRAIVVLLAGALVALAASQVNAQVSEAYRPYSCGANQGNGCVVGPTFNPDGTTNTAQVNVLSYGANGSFQNIFSSGLDKIYCAPHGGKHVEPYTCQIQPVELPKVTKWDACTVDANGRCNPPMAPQQYRIARFGNESRWIYQFVAGAFLCPTGTAESFAGIKINPLTGKNELNRTGMRCEWSTEQFPAIPGRTWTTCAASTGVECRFPSQGDYLVRINSAAANAELSSATYRTVTGSKIMCSIDALGAPKNDAAERWSCEYLPLPTFISVKGDWNLVGLCTNCGNVNFNVTSGVEKGSSKDTESAFTWQLGASMSASAGSPLVMEATVDISANYTNDSRNIVSNSFTQNQSTSFSIECGAGSLYQWVTGVEEVCMPGNAGNCVSVARSNVFRCLPSNLPAGQPPIQFVAAPAAAATPAAGSTTPSSATPSGTTPTSTTPSSTTPVSTTPSSTPASTTTTTVVTPPDTATACTDTWTSKFKRNLSATKNEVRRLLTPDGQQKLEALPTSTVSRDDYLNICVKNGGPAG